MSKQPWFVFSSSSGETFERFYHDLDAASRESLQAFFVDRECGARAKAEALLGTSKVFAFERKDFEAKALAEIRKRQLPQAVIFLCGYFGILSETFLGACPHALLNTHPSLLPAFPGLDQKVHKTVFEQAHFSGFSLHLVNESLDGGALIFQKSVSILGAKDWEESRQKVRQVEQEQLPKIWPQILEWPLSSADRHATAREVAERYPVDSLY